MATHPSSWARARFGRFQVDLSSGELLRAGVRVPIQEQPLQVLRLLLQADGKVVTREQLRDALWPEDTFVDFEHGVNTAVKKLRQALEDSAENPTFVETLPKIGYRFIFPVEWIGNSSGQSSSPRVVPIAPSGPVGVRQFATSDRDVRAARWRWLFARISLGVLVLAAVGVYTLRPRPQTPPDKLTIVPFTTFPGFEIAPSFSPDGNQIVFSWFGYEKEFQFDLYVKQVGQERVVQLTHRPATFLAPAWSPDGRFIAFMRYVDSDPRASGIYLISALGGPERKLAETTLFADWEPIGVTWSADSKWLAFAKSSSASTSDLSPAGFRTHLVNVETTEERVLPPPSQDCVNMWQSAFSPDGKYLASVCVLTDGVAKIYVQTADGQQAREVTKAWSSQGFSGIAWAADSQSLLYGSELHLWRVPLSGGNPEKLLFAQDVESMAVARAGKRLAYSQVRHPSSIWRVELASELKASGPATRLIASSPGDGGGRISPDGKYIVFQSRRSGSPEVWMSDRDASNPVQLSSFGGPPMGQPSWSPDSRRLVFDVRASDNAELYVVNIEGGPPKRFPTGTSNAANPYWSGDGHWIYFNTEHPDSIWKIPAEGGAAIRVTNDGENRSWPQESADGKRLFFAKVVDGHSQAWSSSVNGGDEHFISGTTDVQWVPARKGMYVIDGSSRHFSLHYFDFVTQQSHKVADLPSLFAAGAPAISPDGHTFLFAGIEHSEGDIVLVEGFK